MEKLTDSIEQNYKFFQDKLTHCEDIEFRILNPRNIKGKQIIFMYCENIVDETLLYESLSTIKADLRQIQLFHTDRGNEFKNKTIDEALDTFNIKRSLSMKGCPYDNAVAEATFKIIKTEFVKGMYFDSLEQLKLELDDYVHWFNHIRIHGTLGYLSSIEYKKEHLKKVV